MAVNTKSITGLNSPDGSLPTAAKVRPISGIAADLQVMQSLPTKIDDLYQQMDARNRLISKNKDLTQGAKAAQLKANSDVFEAQIQEFLTMSNDYRFAASQQEVFYTREACLQRAVAYAPAALTESILTRLRRESVPQLMNEAALAASDKDQVLGGCIMIEASARTASAGSGSGPGNGPNLTRGQLDAINELLATIPTDSEKVLPMLTEFDILGREASIRAGKGGPRAKIALGLLKQQRSA